ncbi:MAG: BACON domain-containing protein, partial [Dysgonamonadaceae bacterium]|nr:BACON domain-containing protein [Dysgonamonadaceae bacterium]
MKKAIIAALALSAILFAACDSKENEQSAITVADNSALTQEVYADKTEAAGVKITTTGAWTSYVSEKQTSAKSPQMRAADSPAWISINPASGKEAGSYTIVITLTPNTTGEDRTAIIIITCEDTTITVTITQKATKEDGEIPTSFDGKITGQITGDAASLADVVEIKAFDYKEEWVVATAPVQNGNFTLALPETVENNRLSSFNLESSITLSDANVKQTHINLGEGSCLKVYGNAEKLLGYVHCFSADKKTAIHAFMYVDRDCKITGSVDRDRVTYDVDLKTGWNIIYGKVLNNNVDFELTTTKPDVELRWSVRWFE